MRFVQFEDVAAVFAGKSVAIVGSGPGSLDNAPGFVDGHDVVVRVNNHKTGIAQGQRTDVHYSFYGTSIRKAAADLEREGVRLCMCKLPNSRPIESEWHEQRGKIVGIDYRYIYANRSDWWFCDTFIPDDEHFLAKFRLLGNHQPTTGFSAILDALVCKPHSVFLTGFDGFTSGIHNVDEKWKAGDPTDPICHRPDLELQWLRDDRAAYPMTFDPQLEAALKEPAR